MAVWPFLVGVLNNMLVLPFSCFIITLGTIDEATPFAIRYHLAVQPWSNPNNFSSELAYSKSKIIQFFNL